jgi:feruloyl esterase
VGGASDGGAAGAAPATAGSSCSSALEQTLPSASITGAMSVPPQAGNPGYCLVSARQGGSLNFQVALPDNWNHRLLFVGGGGFDGVIPDVSASPGTLAAGYAIVATDSGHQGTGAYPTGDASFALDADALTAFANSATHQVLPLARAIVSLRYGSPPDRVYFEGCSNGGREALIAAQRWPGDFDGIIARAPALNFTGGMTAFHRIAVLTGAKGGSITVGKLTTLASAELRACDDDDGVDDGIIGNPAACQFDPTTLRCAGPSEDGCLTDAELATIAGVRAETPLTYSQKDSLVVYPGWPVGHESDATGWPVWITGTPSVHRACSVGPKMLPTYSRTRWGDNFFLIFLVLAFALPDLGGGTALRGRG